jgi:putative phage-type endonuclease
MSNENINLILNETINYLKKTDNTTTDINLSELSKLKKQVYIELRKKFFDITSDIIDEIFNRLYLSTYTFNNNLNFNEGKNSFREFDDTYPDIEIPPEYELINQQFDKLKNLPQPAQRSAEWYKYRFDRITASDTAAAIDQNPYEPIEGFILKKCDPNHPFHDNATVFHGKKYEPTATMIYEHIYNTRVFEFGALPSDKYPFLGASPDGISSKYTLDNKFSDRLGTMLEIKCPVTRDIYINGPIIGTICPYYYYCQVQQQLACCDLNICDFWQCKITEYKNRSEYINDECLTCKTTYGTDGTNINVDNKLKKGIILEFYPKSFIPEFEGDLAEWKSKYIMPKRLDMDESQYDTWTVKMLDQYTKLYPDICKDYYFYRIIYWKLESSHNVAITRDDKFLDNIIPVLQDTWNKITYYRQNQDKINELKNIVKKRTKYVKIITSYTIHNSRICKDKILFLDPQYNCKNILTKHIPPINYYKHKYIKEKQKDEESDIDDFNDTKNCDFIDDSPIKKNKLNNTQPKTIKELQKDEGSEIDDFNDTKNCDFIDDIPIKKNKLNNTQQKTIKELQKDEGSNIDDFNDTKNCDFIDDIPIKKNNLINTHVDFIDNDIINKKTINKKIINKKTTIYKPINSECDFIDD